MSELGVIGPNRAAVGTKDGGVFSARDVAEGLVKVAGNGCAVLTFEVDVFAVSQFELAHQGVIGVGDSGKFAAGNGEKLIGAVKGSGLGNDGAGFGGRMARAHET